MWESEQRSEGGSSGLLSACRKMAILNLSCTTLPWSMTLSSTAQLLESDKEKAQKEGLTLVRPNGTELKVQESLKLKRQRPEGGLRGLRVLEGVSRRSSRQCQGLRSTEHCCLPHSLVRGAFSKYNYNHVPPFESTGLSIDRACIKSLPHQGPETLFKYISQTFSIQNLLC